MKTLNRLTAKIILLSSFVIVVFTTQSCQQAPKDLTEEIRKANVDFTNAFNSSDASAMANVYTSDGSLLPPNSEIISGTEAIKTFWQGVFDAGITRGELETVTASGSGNHAVEEGRFKIYAGDPWLTMSQSIVGGKK